jgi:hypothetical protein
MSQRKKWLLVLAVVIALASLWTYWRSGGFLQVSGTILVPTARGTEMDTSMYSVTLRKNVEIQSYFKNEKYGDIKYPHKRKEDFICAAKNLAENYYAVLRVKKQ